MIFYCMDTINSMPTCACDCPFVWSQIHRHLSNTAIEKYKILCDRVVTKPETAGISARELNRIMVESVREKVAVTWSPAITLLMKITHMDKKFSKSRATKESILALKPCISFCCKGHMSIEIPDGYKCDKCDVIVCNKCDAIREYAHHICKQENVKSKEYVSKTTRCPNCLRPSTKDVGCQYVTCPYCNVNFSIETGELSTLGGHSTMVTEHVLTIDTLSEDPVDTRMLLEIMKLKPLQNRAAQPHIRFENKVNIRIYTKTVDRMFELKSLGSLSTTAIINILKYIKTL